MEPISRQRYEFLDGMRGVAALYVLLFHIGTRFLDQYIVEHGYLAVDFFFILSGFVLTDAYQQKLETSLSFTAFVKVRLLRLLPMSILGVLVGAAYLLMRWVVEPGRSDPLPAVLAAVAVNLLLLPKLWLARSTGGELFPNNGALWSLFAEVAVNLVWALTLKRVPLVLGALIWAASGSLLFVLALHHGSLDLGWSLATISGGLCRATFGFLTGVALYRLRGAIGLQGAWTPWAALALLSLSLCMPIRSIWWDLACIYLFLPASLALSVNADAAFKFPGRRQLGEISYPLYAIHLPILMWLSGAQKQWLPHAPVTAAVIPIAIGIVGLAYLVQRFYDEPLRQGLRPVLLRNRPAAAGSTPGST